MPRCVTNKSNLKVGPYYFELVDNFKHLGVNVSDKNNMHNEIQIRISAANRAYFAMNKMFSSKMQNLVYHPKDEEKLLTFKKKMLQKIYGI